MDSSQFSINRGDLNNAQWARLLPFLPPQKPATGRPAVSHRQVVNGIRWILRTGAPWRDLPDPSIRGDDRAYLL